MTCRASCQPLPEPQRHLLTFSPPDLPDGYAECLLCGDLITAVEFLGGVCQGPVMVAPIPILAFDVQANFVTMVAESMRIPRWLFGESCEGPAVKHSDQLNAWRSGNEFDAGRESTLAMIARCAEHQL